MSGDPKLRVGKSLVGIGKELWPGAGEVPALYRAAESALAQGQAESGLRQAVQGLAKGFHAKGTEQLASGAFVPKDASNRAECAAKEAVKIFRETGDKGDEALALGLLADVFLVAGETTKALKNAQMAVALYRRMADTPGEVTTLGTIINAHLGKATAGFNPQLEMVDKAEEKMEAMRQQRENSMGMALEAAKEVVTLHRGMGDRKGEAEALDRVAMVHLLQEEHEQCKSVAREERSIYQEMNDVKGEASALQTIIHANLQNEEDYDDALIAAKDVLKLYRGRDRKTDEEDKKGIADALHTLAKVLHQKFDMQEALESAEEALKLYTEVGEKKSSAACCQTLAQIHLTMQKPAEALKCAKQATEDYQDAGDGLGEANALHELAVMDMEDLLTEVEKDPKTFGKEHADRLEAAWKPLEASLAAYRSIKNAEGEFSVIETINTVIERSRQIHIRVAEPTKTIYITDPVTRQVAALHIFDTVPPAGAGEAGEEEGAEEALEIADQ